jgi:chemotaxis response regulator CheB
MNRNEIESIAEIKIIIADDHPLVRQGLRQAIEIETNFRVVAEAGDGLTALDLIETHKPRIVVLDVDMPALDGFGVAHEIKRRELDIPVVSRRRRISQRSAGSRRERLSAQRQRNYRCNRVFESRYRRTDIHQPDALELSD